MAGRFRRLCGDAGIPAFVRRPRGRDEFTSPAAELARERLRVPLLRARCSGGSLGRRSNDRKFDTDAGSTVVITLPENPSMMLLQDALTRAQA